jgi:hypothetical protein
MSELRTELQFGTNLLSASNPLQSSSLSQALNIKDLESQDLARA